MSHATLREQVAAAIRNEILFWIEREFAMIASVESDKLAASLAPLAAGVVLGAVQAELDALIRDGDYYEQFELGRKMKLLDSDEVLAVLARLAEGGAA